MKKSGFVLIFLLAVLACGTNSYALPIIDFADSAFSVVAGKNTETVYNVYGHLDITFSAQPANALLTYNPGPGGGVDGIGIKDDEISLDETMQIGFSSDLYLSKIYITDLFYEGDPAYQEEGHYRLYSGGSWSAWGTFIAPATNLPFSQTNGEYEIVMDPLLAITAIQFQTLDLSRNDFSIRGVDPVPTPEPATMLLVGFSLIGMAGAHRRMTRKNKNT